jgi:undecaprenyl pyrophosphate phosphatase UppP
VFLPVSDTKPAEFMPTKSASHMIAALILFNWFMALGAIFGICHNPGNVLALCGILEIPLLGVFAVRRFM